jgi:hypothetical protein
MWQRSKRSLFLSLGFALFVLVGFLYMLGAYYMPLAVRVPHTLEILADSFTHAGLLVVLLANGKLAVGSERGQTCQVADAARPMETWQVDFCSTLTVNS